MFARVTRTQICADPLHPRQSAFYFLPCLIVALNISATLADDPFADGVRTTPHLSPAEEQKAFTLPSGFEIELFAAKTPAGRPHRLWPTSLEALAERVY